MPCSYKALFVLENGLEPKKPLCADKGDGWTDLMTQCLDVSIKVSFFCAKAPHRINTINGFFLDILLITLSVNISQPICL